MNKPETQKQKPKFEEIDAAALANVSGGVRFAPGYPESRNVEDRRGGHYFEDRR